MSRHSCDCESGTEGGLELELGLGRLEAGEKTGETCRLAESNTAASLELAGLEAWRDEVAEGLAAAAVVSAPPEGCRGRALSHMPHTGARGDSFQKVHVPQAQPAVVVSVEAEAEAGAADDESSCIISGAAVAGVVVVAGVDESAAAVPSPAVVAVVLLVAAVCAARA